MRLPASPGKGHGNGSRRVATEIRLEQPLSPAAGGDELLDTLAAALAAR